MKEGKKQKTKKPQRDHHSAPHLQICLLLLETWRAPPAHLRKRKARRKQTETHTKSAQPAPRTTRRPSAAIQFRPVTVIQRATEHPTRVHRRETGKQRHTHTRVLYRQENDRPTVEVSGRHETSPGSLTTQTATIDDPTVDERVGVEKKRHQQEKRATSPTSTTPTEQPATTAPITQSPQHPQHFFRTTAIEVVEPGKTPSWTASESPVDTSQGGGAARNVDCVRVCVMMVEQHQHHKFSPAHDLNGTVTPTETTAATASTTMTPTKSNESVTQAAAVNGGEREIAVKEAKPTPMIMDFSSVASSTTAAAKSNGTTPNVVSAFSLPKEVTQYSPLLVGKYYIQDKRAVWTGRWGMTEAAFEENGITSPFEMKSQEDVYIATCSGSCEIVHPAFADGSLARSSRVENVPASEICPAYFGYETDATVRSAMPFHSKYTGFFQIQAAKGKAQTVTEKDVEIQFVHDPSLPSHFLVSGSGENRFGLFSLHGSLDKGTNELRVYKIYKPKEKEKRSVPRRGRAPKLAAQPTAAKLQPKVVLPPISVAAVVTPPVAVAVPELVRIIAPRPVLAPVVDYNSPSLASRGRSERKRVAPAHLREENMIEFDRVPHGVKKCHSILKGVMANPKSAPFLAPVDPVLLGIPDYFQVIKEPMDLGTIRQNLEGGYYDDTSVFADHVRLVFKNAMLYNAAHSQVHIFAVKLLEDFEKRMKSLNMKAAAREKLDDGQKLTKKEKKYETGHSLKKVKGGKGAKGNTKRRISEDDQGLIMSLKEDIERLKATLEQLQPAVRIVTPKPSKPAARPFKMEDLTEEELNEPMSQMDKARLGADIRSLPQDKINRVLQIIAEAVPVAKLANEYGEVEIDINAFDTRCLRMLEGYVREHGIGRKRKRPVSTAVAKKGKSSPPVNRLKSAKVAALNIRNRQEELKHQLAEMESGATSNGVQEKRPDQDVVMTDADDGANVDESEKKQAGGDSSGSSSSSESSDSDSDSESDSDSDGEAPLQRSPSLMSGPALSQISDSSSSRTDAAKKFRDDLSSTEPLKVENRGAWSLLAQKESSNGKSPIRPEDSETSSLWLSARSMEQMKQQKLQQKEKERSEELEAQRRRESEQREREKEREREEVERRKLKLEAQEERVREERAREAERARAAQRVIEREKVTRDDDTEHHEHTLTEDLESFSSSSFL